MRRGNRLRVENFGTLSGDTAANGLAAALESVELTEKRLTAKCGLRANVKKRGLCWSLEPRSRYARRTDRTAAKDTCKHQCTNVIV